MGENDTMKIDIDEKFEITVVECLYDDIGWGIFNTCFGGVHGRDVNDVLKDARSEFKKDRIRVRVYKPQK